MIRTQVYLTKQQKQRLERLSARAGKSQAEILREFVDTGLDDRDKHDQSGISALRALLNMKIKGGDNDLSTKIDYYLYGTDSNEQK